MPQRPPVFIPTTAVRALLYLLCVWIVAPFSVYAAEATADSGDRASPALMAYVQQVLDQHPRLLSAQSEVDAANARQRAAGRAIYNPELDAEYEDGEVRTRSVGINQTIDLGGKRGARERAASFEVQSAMESQTLVRQGVLAELLSALGGYDAAAERLRAADERKALMARLRTLATERRKAGDLNQIDLDLAHLAYAEAALQRAQAAGQQVTAQQALERVSGAVAPRLPSLPSNYAAVTLDESEISGILQQLPSVRVAQARIATAQAVVDLRRRERRPDPTFGLYGGKEGDDNLIGLRFSIPLPVRNSYRAEVDAADADRLALDRSTLNDYRQLRAELVAAVQRYTLSRDAWDEWQQIGAGSLERQTSVLERLWRAGELSTAEYLVQLKQTVDTRVAAIEQRGALWEAWVAWLAVSGQVDDWLSVGDGR
ncbi:MAG TPA: TolC family protein [Woeseiaceae bacterium]|nr:TolC family protein [Woeseiaceae bacterium]